MTDRRLSQAARILAHAIVVAEWRSRRGDVGESPAVGRNLLTTEADDGKILGWRRFDPKCRVWDGMAVSAGSADA